MSTKFKEDLFRTYCVAALRASNWGFSCPSPEKNICFSLCDGNTIETGHSLFIRSNFKLQEWMVGPELYEESTKIKAHFNRCFSKKCGGVAVIIDINGYGEINDFILSGNVPDEIAFYVQIRRILHTSITNLELKIQTDANDFVYKIAKD